MRVIDSHMHLLDVTQHDWYPGLKQMADAYALPHLYQDFLLEDYRTAAGDITIDKFVHVSATTKSRAYLDETEWSTTLADNAQLDMVHIGTVDPSLPATGIVADLEAQASSPRFRGVRVLGDLEPGSHAAGTILSWLAEHGQIFDLVTAPAEMTAWLRTLASYPELTVVLEHTGWPSGTDEAARTEWEDALQRFASETNSACKISGLGMTTVDLSESALRPWIEYAFQTLGWDRVMFGSNMPIETMAGSYTDYLATLRAILAEAGPQQQQKFWADNAERIYRF